jgi:hypothetical protein
MPSATSWPDPVVTNSQPLALDRKIGIQHHMASEPPPSNDPTPERRKGDSSFLPVIIISGIVIVLILIVAVLMIKSRQHKIIPARSNSSPTSQVLQRGPNTLVETANV